MQMTCVQEDNRGKPGLDLWLISTSCFEHKLPTIKYQPHGCAQSVSGAVESLLDLDAICMSSR